LEDEVRTLAPEDNPVDYYFTVAVRRDGKLWFVDRATGTIVLASSTGAKLRQWTLPYAFERDLEAEKEMQESFLREFSPRLAPSCMTPPGPKKNSWAQPG